MGGGLYVTEKTCKLGFGLVSGATFQALGKLAGLHIHACDEMVPDATL